MNEFGGEALKVVSWFLLALSDLSNVYRVFLGMCIYSCFGFAVPYAIVLYAAICNASLVYAIAIWCCFVGIPPFVIDDIPTRLRATIRAVRNRF